MKIGQVAKLTGCNIETIRYYEKVRILGVPPRKGTYREYGPADVERLRFVRRARALGFSLDEIRTLLDLAPQQEANCAMVQSVAAKHLQNVRAKMADLAKIETALCDLVDQCNRQSDQRCPVVRSLAGET